MSIHERVIRAAIAESLWRVPSRTAAPLEAPAIKAAPAPGFVYFAEACGAGRVKIGYSQDPHRRVRMWQDGCPFRIRILAAVEGDRAAEHALHVRFKALRCVREWFRLEGELAEHIELLRKK